MNSNKLPNTYLPRRRGVRIGEALLLTRLALHSAHAFALPPGS